MKSISRVMLLSADAQDVDDAQKVLGKLRCDVAVLRGGLVAHAALIEAGEKAVLPELILIDLKLPEIDGLRFLRSLRMHRRTSAIPVIVLVNSVVERHVLETFNLGLHSYLPKPLTYAKFIYTLPALNLQLSDSILYRKAE